MPRHRDVRFLGLAAASFPGVPAASRKGTIAMTDELTVDYVGRGTGRPAVGRTGPRHPAAARHLERQLAVPRDRHPPLHHSPLRPRHQLVASRPALPRRKLAQHAPLRSHLRQAWRRSPADRYLRRRHPHLRALRLGHRRALAGSRPPGRPPSRSRSAPAAARPPEQRRADLAGTSLDAGPAARTS